MEGERWEGKIRYIVYNAEGKVGSETNYTDLQLLVNILNQESTKVKTVRCIASRLGSTKYIKACCSCFFSLFEGQLKHHFIEIEVDSGEFLTVEKTPEVYLLQKSPAPQSELQKPQVRLNRECQPRLPKNEINSLEVIVKDDRPKSETVARIVAWIARSELMMQRYHLGDDNCQHFATLLWSQLSGKPYPNPSKHGMEIPTMNDFLGPLVDGQNPTSSMDVSGASAASSAAATVPEASPSAPTERQATPPATSASLPTLTTSNSARVPNDSANHLYPAIPSDPSASASMEALDGNAQEESPAPVEIPDTARRCPQCTVAPFSRVDSSATVSSPTSFSPVAESLPGNISMSAAPVGDSSQSATTAAAAAASTSSATSNSSAASIPAISGAPVPSIDQYETA